VRFQVRRFKVSAQIRRYAVKVKLAIEMIKLVLDNAGLCAVKLRCLWRTMLIAPADKDA
jgi:hypothetical protein